MGVEDAQPHLDVYLAACEVIDLIREVEHRQLSTADAKPQVLAAIGHWNVLHRALYKKRYVKPKHFWMWLVAVRLADAEWLFDMFYAEGQHRRVRPPTQGWLGTQSIGSPVFYFAACTRDCAPCRGQALLKIATHC